MLRERQTSCSPLQYCKARVDLPGVKFGLAAYDVNYDHGVSNSTYCEAKKTKIGDFVRVQIMKENEGRLSEPSFRGRRRVL
ncbi:hypothetical protein MRX96_034251 [Rhipicephalus microplus]